MCFKSGAPGVQTGTLTVQVAESLGTFLPSPFAHAAGSR